MKFELTGKFDYEYDYNHIHKEVFDYAHQNLKQYIPLEPFLRIVFNILFQNTSVTAKDGKVFVNLWQKPIEVGEYYIDDVTCEYELNQHDKIDLSFDTIKNNVKQYTSSENELEIFKILLNFILETYVRECARYFIYWYYNKLGL